MPELTTAPTALEPDQRVIPSRDEPLVADATRPLGGPLGEHAAIGRHWFWSPQRVGLLLAVGALMLCWLGKGSCVQQFTDDQGDNHLDWRAGRPYVAMCYTDIVPLYGDEHLGDPNAVPYKTTWVDKDGQTTAMDYPVLTGYFQWANAKLTGFWLRRVDAGWLPGGLPVTVYFDITALLLSAGWLVTVWATGRTLRRRPWDAALVAISPLVLVQAFTNFDTIATAFTAVGLLAWSRRRPAVAGVLLGLGAAAKLYPLLLLGPLFVLCLRAARLRSWAATAGSAVVAWSLVNLPVALAYPWGWSRFFRLGTTRPMDDDSIYHVLSYFTGWAGFDGTPAPGRVPVVLDIVSAGLFVACCVGIAYLGLAAPRRPRLGQLGFLVVAAFLLTGKVWNPQYSLWLVPLAVLAIPRWRLLLGWMLIDALVWVPRMFYYLGPDRRGLPEGWFAGTVVVRDLVVLGLCVLVVREIYRPGTDPVRVAGDDDPAGGFLDGAGDRWVFGRGALPA